MVGDLAYTAGFEHTSASINGQPRSYILRATQVYRREGGDWKVAHRHADTVDEGCPLACPDVTEPGDRLRR